MFNEAGTGTAKRVLMASANAEDRRSIGEVVKTAGLRAVGFVRDAEQVTSRTLLSMPDVLLLDMAMFRQTQTLRMKLSELHASGPIKIVLCGQTADRTTAQWQREGIDGVLDLGDAGVTRDLNRMAKSLHQMLTAQVVAPKAAPAANAAPSVPMIPGAAKRKTLQPGSVVVGSSTGGPVALMTMLKGLPADFPLPVAVVQHMPPGFTRMLAERLNAECAIRVVEAEAGMPFQAGTVYIAPGGCHMVLSGSPKSPVLELNMQEPENSCRPAVDVLFRSSAEVFGGRQQAIVLTGMGRDGLLGARQLHALGSRIVVQDAATSTVWGMPGAIAQAGYADDVLPIDQIAPQLIRSI